MQNNALRQTHRADDDRALTLLPDPLPVPATVLARWAAMASQRAYPGFLPTQAPQQA
ncbi:hypothetical protein [Cellulomonas bogoriensis]|uniref:hypothetical protein n=1 Tax=Cellulomonas bogoriensis TaxID=301388 RepID=UPI000AC4DF56|nr:hypothetical protein [Cellulomonas bogoriensis]